MDLSRRHLAIPDIYEVVIIDRRQRGRSVEASVCMRRNIRRNLLNAATMLQEEQEQLEQLPLQQLQAQGDILAEYERRGERDS
ncbi:hypothetical protein ETB97_006003 [Aspergillus alliaceus]|uniref:Uncharacterized protein n=1 Tax=Petromyces alliaceus TaxID=209559 RepID=A0A8H6A0P8_PETAA|nr:hypothetical protein ETB97_006003 [Aspergillus burnettii]